MSEEIRERIDRINPEKKSDVFVPVLIIYILGSLYLAGLLFFIFRIIIDYLSLHFAKRNSTIAEKTALVDLFYILLEELQMKQPVRLLINPQIEIPVSFGLPKHFVILPESLIKRGDLSLIRIVLIHELTHIQHRDWIMLLIRRLMQTLLPGRMPGRRIIHTWAGFPTLPANGVYAIRIPGATE